MAVTDASAVSTMLAVQQKLRPDKAQFVRSRQTTALFRPRKQWMKGSEFRYKVFTQPVSGARAYNAVTDEQGDWPAARKFAHEEVQLSWSHLCEIRGSLEWTGLAEAETRDRETSIYKAAEKLLNEVDNDLGGKLNAQIHQDANLTMGKVSAQYQSDGTSWADGQGYTSCYLKIADVGIMNFVKGQYLHVRNGTSTSTPRCIVEVRDVWPQSTGPGGTAAIGPGITVTYREAGSAANLDTIAANDTLCMSGDTNKNFFALPSFFSYSAAFFNITRSAVGSRWTIPLMADYTANSASVPLDVEIHFGKMALEWGQAVKTGRNMRKADGVTIDAQQLVCLTTDKVVDEWTRQMGDRVKLTINLTEAARKELFGMSGFDGGYFHHPNIGYISLVSDPVASVDKVRLLTPDSFFWVTGHEGGDPESVEWLDRDGSKIHYEYGTNGLPKNVMTCGYLTRVTLANDQPTANYEIAGVTTSLT